ncbi:putative piggyBac transposable element-derived protein 4-like [Triplophysa rosa]|uniref:PiggyBac transposable element-derived protein 4-like n=1 Tax=Triplophysa rosa TaxID=992332 RepID=A0A9W7T4R1_TRIRA|nr:putative piggyBac transposable element-derived protein 4-like [Triplophysa rosa]
MATFRPKRRYWVLEVIDEIWKSSDEQENQSSEDEPDLLLPDGEMSDSAPVWNWGEWTNLMPSSVISHAVLRKTRKWYRSLFLHFVDIGVVTAFILHQQLAASQNQRAKTQREFREALVLELADWMPASSGLDAPPATVPQSMPTAGHHRPRHANETRRRCRVCHQKTAVYCHYCDLFLCFKPSRDCFNNYHDVNNL